MERVRGMRPSAHSQAPGKLPRCRNPVEHPLAAFAGARMVAGKKIRSVAPAAGTGPVAGAEPKMTSAEVRAIVEAEIGSDWSQPNAHGIDLRECLVEPRLVSCRNTFPRLHGGRPLTLWIVLEE